MNPWWWVIVAFVPCCIAVALAFREGDEFARSLVPVIVVADLAVLAVLVWLALS